MQQRRPTSPRLNLLPHPCNGHVPKPFPTSSDVLRMRFARAMRFRRARLSATFSHSRFLDAPSSTTDVEQLLDAFLRAPSVASGKLRGGDVALVRVARRDLVRDATQQAAVGPVRLSEGTWNAQHLQPQPCDAEYAAECTSPSGKWTLRMRSHGDGEAKATLLEVWDGCGVACEVHVPQKVHGPPLADGWFASCAWDEPHMRVVYVAQASKKEPIQLGNRTGADGEKENDGGGGWKAKGKWEPDWGEAYEGQRAPRLFVLDIAARRVEAVPVRDEETSVGQAVWTPQGDGIVFAEFPHAPSNFANAVARLGAIYCTRPSKICHIHWPASAEEKPCPITEDAEAAVSPRFTPQGDAFVYLSRRAALHSGTHQGTVELARRNWPDTEQHRILVPVVEEPEAGQFPGLYLQSLEPTPWVAKGQALLATTIWRSGTAIVALDPSGANPPCRISTTGVHHGAWTLLDASEDFVLASRSSPALPAALMVAKVPGDPFDPTAWHWEPMEFFSQVLSDDLRNILGRIRYRFVKVEPTHDVDSHGKKGIDAPFEAILIESADTEGLPGPAILCPHGGPHATFVCNWSPEYAFLCTLGYKIILVNYRGSLGFGEAALQSLPGKVGQQDVTDMLAALDKCIELGCVDASRVAVMGGSHGGFLTGHLLGQAPDRFRCGILRNPVCNIAGMVNVTDIPDWCHIEVLGAMGKELYSEAPDPEMLQKMYDHSPIAHAGNITAPTLFHLGAKDRRVPYSDALQMMRFLRSKGQKAEAIMFPEDKHPLDKPRTEYERCLSAQEFLQEHIPPL